MRHLPALSAVLLAAGLALTGCANGDAQTQQAAVTGASSASPSSSASTEATAESPTAPSTSSSAFLTEDCAPSSGASTAPTSEPSQAPAQPPARDTPRVVEPAPGETPVQAITPPYSGQPAVTPPNVGGIPPLNFTYEQAYAAWRGGMPYYDAFCLHYKPVTAAGVSQCDGIYYGTVDAVTGEYIGPR